MKQLAILFSGFLLSGLLFSVSSCKKETDCKARIKCIDSLGAVMPNANVLLYANVKDPNDPQGQNTYTADVKAEGVTDGGGVVQFTFKLPAIFDIRATKAIGTRTLVGSGLIKLEEGKTVEKVVTVK
jgi:hypothetical protein